MDYPRLSSLFVVLTLASGLAMGAAQTASGAAAVEARAGDGVRLEADSTLARSGKPVRAAANGCGGQDSEWIPERWPDVFDFESACNRHDDCYETLGKTKKICDKQFLTDMKRSCGRYSPQRRVRYGRKALSCAAVARFVYYRGVRTLPMAIQAYLDAQRNARDRGGSPQPPDRGSGSSFEPNESLRAARGPLTFGSTYEGAIVGRDEDWFFVNRSNRRQLAIRFAHAGCIPEPVPPNLDSDGCPIFNDLTAEVYDPRGKIVQQAFYVDGRPRYLAKITVFPGQEESMRVQPELRGKYYLRVFGYSPHRYRVEVSE